LPTNELRVRRRYCLSQLLAGHPADAHSHTGLLDPDEIANDVHELVGLGLTPHLGELKQVLRVLGGNKVNVGFKKPVPVGPQLE
jgi:hypothetical protein